MGSGGTTALVPPGKFLVLKTGLFNVLGVNFPRASQSHTCVCAFLSLGCRLDYDKNSSFLQIRFL
ncbi:hypothetical protein, partial [Rosenbergiella epipactidis]|uniref:hypothetical protein n=1 Tax=Rosenbergiella epipactidis TaxID=1544694 RepID=UPI001BDAE09D